MTSFGERRLSRPLALPLTLALALLCAAPAAAQNPPRKAAPAKKAQEPPPDPLRDLLLKADAALEKGDYAAAAETLEEFIARKADYAPAHFQLGYAYTALDRLDDARRCYQRAAELDPQMAPAHLNLGLTLLESDPAAAVPHLARAAELLPNEARPHFLLGQALERSGKLEPARERYRAAAGLDPADYEARFALARTLLALERFPESEAAFRAALERRPGSGPARLGLAASLHSQEKNQAAAEEFAAYLQLEPGDAGARLRLAALYLELGRPAEALAQLEAAEKAGLRRAELFEMRAEAHRRESRFAEAAAALAQAVELAPGDARLRALRGRMLLELRDFPAAQEELQAALRLDAQATDALRDLVAAYYLAEDYPAALRWLEALARLETLNAGAWFIRATSYDKLRMVPEAVAAYEKFLELDQGRSEKQDFQARHRLQTLKRMLERSKRR